MIALATFTNTYADQHIPNYVSYGDKDGAWISTTDEELYSFVAVIIYMGIVHASGPTVDRYWSMATLYSGLWTRHLLSSRTSFQALLTFLHIVDPNTEDMHDKLRKVRFLYDHIGQCCKDLYQPSRQFSVDERMVKSKGRFPFKQYIENKKSALGIQAVCIILFQEWLFV